MRFNSYKKIGGWLLLVVFLLACALPAPLASAPDPTQDPNSFSPEMLGTAIIETAEVAQTRTAAAMPPTLTPTLTREATSTFIVASTPTFFSLLTETPVPIIPLETTDPLYAVTEGVSDLGNVNDPNYVKYTGEPWTCGIRSITPRGGMIKAGTGFYAYFTVVNTGTTPWTSNTVDFVYKSGLVQEDARIQDLRSTVASGSLATFKVFYKAPKKAGEYGAIWTLRVGRTSFCGMSMFFEVPKGN